MIFIFLKLNLNGYYIAFFKIRFDALMYLLTKANRKKSAVVVMTSLSEFNHFIISGTRSNSLNSLN